MLHLSGFLSGGTTPEPVLNMERKALPILGACPLHSSSRHTPADHVSIHLHSVSNLYCFRPHCLGVGPYEPVGWIATHPGTHFAICPAEQDCHLFGRDDITRGVWKDPAGRSVAESCFLIRMGANYERWQLRRNATA